MQSLTALLACALLKSTSRTASVNSSFLRLKSAVSPVRCQNGSAKCSLPKNSQAKQLCEGATHLTVALSTKLGHSWMCTASCTPTASSLPSLLNARPFASPKLDRTSCCAMVSAHSQTGVSGVTAGICSMLRCAQHQFGSASCQRKCLLPGASVSVGALPGCCATSITCRPADPTPTTTV